MPNKRIDQLNPNFDALTGNELIPIFDTNNNSTERITLNTLANFVDSTTDTFVTGATYNNTNDVLTLGTNNNGFVDVTINRYNRWYIPSGQTLTTPSNFQSFIYGDLIVDGTLMLEENSQLVVLNGDIILSGGTISGTGTTYIVDLPEFNTFVTSGNFNPSTKQITFNGNFGFTPFNVDLSSLSTDNFYTTGATLNGNTIEFDRTDLTNAYSVDLSPLITNSFPNLYVSNLYGNSPITVHDSVQSTGSTASGILSFSFGSNTLASGNYSHAEGIDTVSSGLYSHSEGVVTVASGEGSHAEGSGTISSGLYSHAEGFGPVSSGQVSHAEGNSTIASGDNSHAEGYQTVASGYASHAEGGTTIAGGDYSHTGGLNSIANGVSSFIHSNNSLVSGDRSVVLGGQNITGTTSDVVYVPNLNINYTPTTNNSLSDILVRNSDGSINLRQVSSISSSINYSNVTFVDAVNGDDLTGTINRFDRPYLTVASALVGSTSTPGLSSTNRGLVYVRRGVYNNVVINLQNNIDIYCEPGVVFTGQVIVRDNGLVVDTEFLGYVKIINSSANEVLRITADSFVTFEFDTLTSTGAAFGIFCPTLNNQIIIKGNNVSGDTLGFGYCITIRDGSNVVLDIKNKIESQHVAVFTRRVQGNVYINASQIVLRPGNIYGGNYKHNFLIANSTANPGRIVVNADLVNQDTVYYSGISSMIRFWESPNTNVKINGNIVGGVTLGAVMSNGSSTMTIDGDVSSNLTTLASDGSNNLTVMNSSIVSSGTVVSNFGSSRVNLKNCTLIRRTSAFTSPFSVGGSSTTYINDCTYYNEFFGNSFNIESSTASLYIKDFVSEGFFTGGTSYNINNNVGNPTVGVINMVSNKVNNPALTPLYSYGAVVEPNLNVPKFF